MTPTTLNCGGSVTIFAAAEVVASAVAETVLLEDAIGSKQVQAAFGHTNALTAKPVFLASCLMFVLLPSLIYHYTSKQDESYRSQLPDQPRYGAEGLHSIPLGWFTSLH